jgi:hypothetical protein
MNIKRLISFLSTWGIVSGLLVVSVLLNVGLAWRSHVAEEPPGLPPGEKPALGSVLPPILAKGLDGSTQVIKVAGPQPTLLYVFGPQCGYCARNIDNLHAVTAAIGGRYRVIGLSLHSETLNEYLTHADMKFSIYAEPDAASVTKYRFAATPETWVVSADGHLDHRWIGAWHGDTQNEIEAVFGLKLPGLRPPTARPSAHPGALLFGLQNQ